MSALPDGGSVLLTWAEYVKFEEVHEGRRHEPVRGLVRFTEQVSIDWTAVRADIDAEATTD